MATILSPSQAAVISPEPLHLSDIVDVARRHRLVALSPDEEFRGGIRRGRELLERKLAEGEVVYGVNTGFGGNARFVIHHKD